MHNETKTEIEQIKAKHRLNPNRISFKKLIVFEPDDAIGSQVSFPSSSGEIQEKAQRINREIGQIDLLIAKSKARVEEA